MCTHLKAFSFGLNRYNHEIKIIITDGFPCAGHAVVAFCKHRSLTARMKRFSSSPRSSLWRRAGRRHMTPLGGAGTLMHDGWVFLGGVGVGCMRGHSSWFQDISSWNRRPASPCERERERGREGERNHTPLSLRQKQKQRTHLESDCTPICTKSPVLR